MTTTASGPSRRNLLVGGGIGATALLGAMATPAIATPMAFVPPAPTSGGLDWSLYLDGIPGENTHLGHKGEIPLLAFDWPVTNAVTPTAGSANGRAKSGDISMAFNTSKASPLLLQRCVQGKHIASAKISGRHAGEGQKDYIFFDFTEVAITSYDVAFTMGPPLDVITITFATLVMTYRPIDDKGGLGAPISVSWNLKTNRVS